jgi:hypothetical protein
LAYNLEVEGIHAYHVGDDDVLVHNVCRTFTRLASGDIPNTRGVYVIRFRDGQVAACRQPGAGDSER